MAVWQVKRLCKVCQEMKPPEDFQPTYRKTFVRNQCRACRYKKHNERARAKYVPAPPREIDPVARLASLTGHLNEPTIKNAVLDYARQLGAPFLLGEIARPLQLPRTVVNRVLRRELKRGVLTRHAIPVQATVSAGLPGAGHTFTRMEFLYALTENAE